MCMQKQAGQKLWNEQGNGLGVTCSAHTLDVWMWCTEARGALLRDDDVPKLPLCSLAKHPDVSGGATSAGIPTLLMKKAMSWLRVCDE